MRLPSRGSSSLFSQPKSWAKVLVWDWQRFTASCGRAEATSGFTVNPDVASALPHDAVNRCQSQTSTFAQLFGCEKRLEDPRDGSRIHTDAGIAHRQQGIFAGGYRRMLCAEGLVKIHSRRFQNQLPTARHGIAGIHGQVQQDLVKLPRVDLDQR